MLISIAYGIENQAEYGGVLSKSQNRILVEFCIAVPESGLGGWFFGKLKVCAER
jgi:hypothetical protein